MMRRLLRDRSGAERRIEPRLVELVGRVARRFPGGRIEVVSGYRPRRRGQPTRHSRHNVGAAIDFRVEGVANEVLRDYCRATFRNAGIGYYPHSSFVHLDARDRSAYWVDLAGPGEAPRYVRETPPPASAAAP